jgi:hypothetical protein
VSSKPSWRRFVTDGTIGKIFSYHTESSYRKHGRKPYTVIPFGRR